MSINKLLVVLGVIILAFFAYIAYTDAVRVSVNAQTQKQQMSSLDTEYKELDTKLEEKKEVKEQTETEVQELERIKQELEAKRQEAGV